MEYNLITKLIMVFVAGFIVDLLITKYTKDVSEKKIWSATFLSGLITLANFVFITILLRDSVGDSIFSIVAFASGNCCGTFFVMKRK